MTSLPISLTVKASNNEKLVNTDFVMIGGAADSVDLETSSVLFIKNI